MVVIEPGVGVLRLDPRCVDIVRMVFDPPQVTVQHVENCGCEVG